jgi:hypothetical protein
MHGIELRDRERRTLRLSAPLRTFSPSAGSMLSSTPPAASLSGPGRSQRPFARPQRLSPLGDLHSGVKAPGLPLRALPDRLPCPFDPSAPLPRPGLPRSRPLQRLRPVALSPSGSADRVTVSTPLQDSYIPRDQSVQRRLLPAGPPGKSARSPFAPRCPSFSSVGLRINVPGSLRVFRLAVPQPLGTFLTMLPNWTWVKHNLTS